MPQGLVKTLFVAAAVACLSTYINSPVALVGGSMFAWLIGHPFLKWNGKMVNWLLKSAVVGLGFGMNLNTTLQASQDGLFLTIAAISLVLIVGYLLGKMMGLRSETTHLVSSGTAICGGSAIAAVAPVINATEKDISVALGVVLSLNSIALLTFPPIGHFFELSQQQFGLWSAIAIHDTSSVVGAAHTYGHEALQVATTVKLSRALWIIPLAILSLFLFKGEGNKVKIPWFILLFILAVVANSFWPLPEMVSTSITTTSKSMLVLTLFLVGAGMSISKIKAAGWKPMVLGLALWVMVSVGSLITIMAM